ncbi:ATPases [Longilinea arvoryzae]|uniref:Iron-sulfur cluster carrier protein n=1 Tax=Longilinea arvoryzae TaxID=360412 RepID=A0A0S7BJS4_9CHLR|nr:Mrp/NBP35 family ATP-binding protein [Longilinea arvoryzae]GAP14568.1 ATPases [Longilinea arvoryzae]
MPVTTEVVMAALSKVEEPELHKDLVTLNMVQDLKIEGGKVSFEIVLTTPACPLRTRIEKEARQAVLEIAGVSDVEIRMNADVRSDGKPRGLMNLPVKNAVAVASGKGGVGKTTVAVNLAVALAQSGAKVGLLDADIYGPNVPTMMGVDHLPPFNDGKLIPAETYGVKMMSIGFMVPPGKPLIWRGPMLHSAIRQFLSDVAWGELDYLIIDMPPGTGDAQLSLAQSLPLSGGVIVTLPQMVSVEDAARGLAMFNELNVPVLGVIENMSYLELPDGTRVEVFGKGGGELLSKKENVPFLGTIPMDPGVRAGGDEGKPILVSQPQSAPAKALRSLAEQLAARLSVNAFENQPDVSINIIG